MILFDGRFRIKMRRVISITVVWAILGALDALNTYALAETASLPRLLWIHTATAAVAGIISGPLLVFILRDWLRGRSYGFSMCINGLVISLLNFAIALATYDLFAGAYPGSSLIDSQTIEHTAVIVSSASYLRNFIFWMLVVVATLVMLNVNDKYGPGVFAKLLLGRYHRPREEERIFMFVDIRSSAAIAEKLGHIRFFNLLNDFFQDITDPVIATAGEIYQYVGDEVVVSWTMAKGTSNANCIRCFYGMQETVQKYAGRYREKYGLVPEFKAGLHCGPVTIGEIGVIKKDLVFSGDVMNTASRIQGVCNKFRVKILFSKELLDRLQLPPHGFTPKRMGIIELKGKRQRVELYSFEESPLPSVYRPIQ